MSRPVNLIFDFGGVLVDWKPDEILARQFPDSRRRELIRREVLGHPDWVELDRGALSEAEAVTRFARRAAVPAAEIEALFGAVRDALQPKPDTVRILRSLAAGGTPLYGLSNMSLECYDWLRARHDFFGLFDAVVVSGAVRLVKPEPEIYRHLADTHRLVPQQCLFFDDMQANVDAALSCGFQAVRFTDASALETELVRRGIEVR
jgi:putative hydrolase of the HAD superfamily